jgi:SAM-dependent methyltransferase
LKPNLYDEHYYSSEGLVASLESARVVVPIVMSLLAPTSVVDVGCGLGAWLQAFRENGVERIVGVDGDYIDTSRLLIPMECFRAVDITRPFEIDGPFDLAACLEVAEHLPKSCARSLVQRLVTLAPYVLFSAAVPCQGGVHHVNEQWPEFWRGLFAENGFKALDLIRKLIWKNRGVAYWYRQNIFLYVREDLIPGNIGLVDGAKDADDLMLVNHAILHYQMGVRSILRHLMKRGQEAILRRLRRVVDETE